MSVRGRGDDLRALLPHAVMATVVVIVVPLVALVQLVSFSKPEPPLLLISSVAVALAIATSTIGSALWSKRPESTRLPFGELMLWNWALRRRVERRLQRSAETLGFDPTSGRQVGEPDVGPAVQMMVLRDLMKALEMKDPYTRGHTARVERACYNTALVMRLAVKEIETLRKAAAVHDVGKIRVPDGVLRKPEPLTPAEWNLMKEHSAAGASMVAAMGDTAVTLAVRHHHERWDGAGYPDGLAGEAIPLYARLIAVADTYDAIRSSRAYRPGASRRKALAIIRAERGKQFDPEVVDAFLSTVPIRIPFGVAAIGPLTEGIVRRLGSWVRTSGAAAAGPAVGAVGVAAVVGASVFGSFDSGRTTVSRPGDGEYSAVPDAAQPEGREEDHAPRRIRVMGTHVLEGSKREAASRSEPASRLAAAEPPPESGSPDAETSNPGEGGSSDDGEVGGSLPVPPPDDVDVPTDSGRKKAKRIKKAKVHIKGPKRTPGDPKPALGGDCDKESRAKGSLAHCG